MPDLAELEGATGTVAPPEENSGVVTSETTLPGFEAASLRLPRAMVEEAERQRPRIYSVTDDASYAAVPMGATYTDPEGMQRAKPWKVTSAADYERVPEGASYQDPQGNERRKPKFEPVSFTTQTLYDMALTDKERRKIMEREFGADRVHQDAKGLYAIDEDGIYRKPGYGWRAGAGAVTAAAAPVTASVLGAIGGAAAGAPSGPGLFVTGTLGAGTGGLLGQAFNDAMLQLAGVYDRTVGEETANLGKAGLMSMAGAGVGRGAAAVVPTLKEGISRATAAAPAALNKILGASGEDLALAAQIAEKGTSVPPSAVFKGAPHLQNVVERFDPAMDTSNPLLRSIEQHYEREGGKILDTLGVPAAERTSLLEPGVAPGTQRAGEALIGRALQESADADAALNAVIASRRAIAEIDTAGRVAQREALTEAAERSRTAAQQLVDAGYQEIDRTADAAMRVAQAGHNSGDLWQAVGDRLRAVRQGINERMNVMVRQANDLVPPGVVPDTRGLPVIAREFLEQLPEDFRNAYPDMVRRIERLGGVFNEAGEMVRPPIQLSFAELHQLRSLLRSNADWNTLSSDFRNGTYKYFAGAVDDALRNVEAVPALRAAVEQLDRADAFYRENMPIFNARQIKAVMKGLEAGEPADPKVLYDTIIKSGHTDLIERIQGMVGPNLWRGVQGADLRTILDNSRDIVPGVIDGRRFVSEILDRHRSGLLQAVHGEEQANRLLRQAEYVRALTNDRLPITTRPGDTVQDMILRARTEAEAARTAARNDPMGTLQKEMRRMESDERKRAAAAADRKNDPLGFLYDPTTGAAEAVKRILGNEDLILATARRFGTDSKEFEMLRQVYAQQLLQKGIKPGEQLAKISDEVQQLMFPGVTRTQMETLAKEMSFLTDTKLFSSGDFGGALSATAKVEHPIGGRLVSGLMRMVPGTNMAARTALGTYYALARRLSAENPALFTYLLKGLNGTAEEKAATRAILSRHAQLYAGYGAAGGEALYQRGNGQ